MNNPPYLILHDNRVLFSPAASPSPSQAAKNSYSSASLLFVTHNQSCRKLILHGEGSVCEPVICALGSTGHSIQVRNGKQARRHGKPTNFGHRKVWKKMEKEGEKEERPLKLEPCRKKIASSRHRKVKKKMKTQEEGDKEERLLKLERSQPSEDCVSRLFEDQRYRLHNSTPTFQGISQESDMLMQEPPRLLRKEILAYTNGSPPRGSSDADARKKPDFSTRLLKILTGTKKEGELNDVKTTGVMQLEFVGANFGEVMQGLPQSEVFKEVAPRMNELNSYAHSDLSSNNTSDRPHIREDISKFDQLFLEEADFSSESSDEDGRSDVENRQDIHAPGFASSDCSDKLSQGQKTAQLESFSPPHSKGPSFISPRHLSRSSGSRSRPSRSSIPGLRSKYSKPDPKAKQFAKHGKRLCLLPKFEVRTEGSDKPSHKGDDDASNADVHEKELDKAINFDWWELDENDSVTDDSSADVKVFNGHEMGGPLQLQLGSVVETRSCNESPPNARNSGISKRFDTSNKQKVKKPEEWHDFEWSDSDEEGDTRAEDNQLFKWSVSDADSGLSEGRQSDSHAGDRNGFGLVCANAEHSASPQRKWTTKEYGARITSIRPLIWYNREECEKLASISYVDCKPLNQLPPSVKFVEVPPWKSQRLPHLPFEFQFSYSEIPKSPVLGFRDHYSPFAPTTMGRPWTGRHLVKPRSLEARQSYDPMVVKAKLFEFSFNRKGEPPKRVKSREELLGEALTDDEVMRLVQDCHVEKRQVNLGRDGLTHNMLDLIHTHWKRRPVCRIKCRGAPTLDMDNVCFHVEDKTGGQIIYRTGCVLYVFRGRYYSYKHRPVLPLMLYRPSSPVYPKLVSQAPAGLTLEEASQLRVLGQKVRPLIKLQKNGAFPDLVKLVRDAFMVDDLVSLDYGDIKAADYRQIGAKLRELVPCVLLSFRNRRIVLWRGKDSNPLSPHSSQVHEECSAEAIDVEGSVISAADFKSVDISNEALIGEAADDGIEKGADTFFISEKSKEENVKLQHRLYDCLNGSSGSEQHVQERDEPESAARDMVVPRNVLEASSMSGELNGIWDMALKDGVAVELEGDHLEADFILQIATVFSEVAPLGPDYTVHLINRLRLQGVYEKSPRQFVVPFRAKRETLPRWKRLGKQASHVKRHPDTGYAVEVLARILDQN